MIINHPLLGPRDAAEFVYLGDASLLEPPEMPTETTEQALSDWHDHVYLRDNPAGEHRELWFHEQGDRSWLVITRNTLTHEISSVELAHEVALKIAEERGRTAAVSP